MTAMDVMDRIKDLDNLCMNIHKANEAAIKNYDKNISKQKIMVNLSLSDTELINKYLEKIISKYIDCLDGLNCEDIF